MTPLFVYNSETRRKESLIPPQGRALRVYTCGPTVYDYAHIGNFRTYIFEDVFLKVLKTFGFLYTHVMNITDIDDKTIQRAKTEGLPLKTYTEKYTSAFFEDIATLNIQRADAYPKATEYIEAMIEMIQDLIDKGCAYQGEDGSVYFRILSFPSYGRLSHLPLSSLKEGARISSDEYDKGGVGDFVLWKGYDEKRDGDVKWESPFGLGRPGWHIECSAMAAKLLGKEVDVHMGGIDNLFPHHENEIAQSEGCFGNHFVRYWMHCEHLLVEGKKMAKSAGNFYTLRSLLDQGYTSKEVRYLLLQNHYRTQANFSIEGLKSARQSLTRVQECVDRLLERKQKLEGTKDSRDQIESGIEEALRWEEEEALLLIAIQKAEKGFKEALGDDLNMPVALSFLFGLVKEVNRSFDQGPAHTSVKGVKKALEVFLMMDSVLSVLSFDLQDFAVPAQVQEALEKREEARRQKQWAEADQWRALIEREGYVLEDTPEGPRVQKHNG